MGCFGTVVRGASGGRVEERECLASPSVLDLLPNHGVVPPAMGGDLIAPSRVVSDLAQPRRQEALARVVFIQSVGAVVARSDLCCAVTDAQKQHLRCMNSNVLDALWEDTAPLSCVHLPLLR